MEEGLGPSVEDEQEPEGGEKSLPSVMPLRAFQTGSVVAALWPPGRRGAGEPGPRQRFKEGSAGRGGLGELPEAGALARAGRRGG